MLQDLYLFTRGISSFEYDVPIPLQISMYVFVGIILTTLIYVFKDSLDRSILREQYMWLYVLVILNILNIVLTLGYYNSKEGTFIGEEGEKGEIGRRGGIGLNMNCSLCQTNIYMNSTNRYDNITKVDFPNLFKMLIDRQIPDKIDKLTRMMNNDYFDFTEFSSNLLKGDFDMNNETTKALLLLSLYNEFPLINALNQSMGHSDDVATGYFKRPFGKQGYMSLGDTAFGGSDPYETTSFMVNGDIRVPQGFEAICSFITVKESGNVDKYTIFKMIPPEFEEIEDDPDTPKDLTRKPKNDKYVSLGDIVYYNDPKKPNTTVDPLLFSCVKKSCCKKIDPKDMKLMFIYPGASPTTTLNQSAIKNNQGFTEGFFSVWKTPFNTIKIKYSNGDFTDGKTIIETLYTANNGNIDEVLYTRDGRIKKKILGKVELFLKKIRIDKLSSVVSLFGNTVEEVKEDLHQIYIKYIRGNNEISSTPTLNRLRSKSNITLQVIAKSITDLEKVIDDNIKRKLEKAEREMAKVKTHRIRSLGEVKDPKQFKSDTGASYQLQKAYQSVRSKIMNLSVQIENCQNMLDLIKVIFPQGLMGKVFKKDLTSIQLRTLDILRVLVPPNDEVYMLKNECLVFEQVDEKRNELTLELEDEISKFKDLREKINEDAEGYCGSGDVEKINQMVDKTYEIIADTIGHIPDYLNKLLRANFEEITTEKVQILLNQLSKLNNYLYRKCGGR